MASRRLEKYRRKPVEVNNNEEIKIEITPKEKDSNQTPQALIRDWFKCICFRPNTVVECCNTLCGFRAFGRVRKLCRAHPKVTYLLDLPMCPLCYKSVYELPQQDFGQFND